MKSFKSNKRVKRLQRCHSGKKRFKDGIHAKQALRGIAASAHGPAPYRAYECPICKGWHLSSREG